MASVTISLTLCCTAVELPSEKSSVERLGQMTRLGVKDLVDLLPNSSATTVRAVAELGLDLLGDLLELRLDELCVRARLLTIEHPRADLDGVRDDAVGIG